MNRKSIGRNQSQYHCSEGMHGKPHIGTEEECRHRFEPPKIKISGCLTAWKERNMEKQTVKQNENTEAVCTEKEKTAWERWKERKEKEYGDVA